MTRSTGSAGQPASAGWFAPWRSRAGRAQAIDQLRPTDIDRIDPRGAVAQQHVGKATGTRRRRARYDLPRRWRRPPGLPRACRPLGWPSVADRARSSPRRRRPGCQASASGPRLQLDLPGQDHGLCCAHGWAPGHGRRAAGPAESAPCVRACGSRAPGCQPPPRRPAGRGPRPHPRRRPSGRQQLRPDR